MPNQTVVLCHDTQIIPYIDIAGVMVSTATLNHRTPSVEGNFEVRESTIDCWFAVATQSRMTGDDEEVPMKKDARLYLLGVKVRFS